MHTPLLRARRIAGFVWAFFVLSAPLLKGQTAQEQGSGSVFGTVQDANHAPVAGVSVSLEGTDPSHKWAATADGRGQFHFEAVPADTYTLRAKQAGYAECVQGPIALEPRERKSVMLSLVKLGASADDSSNAIAFSDEPTFTVAGVTDTTAMGGHGSGPIVRNSNALSKETASLARGEDAASAPEDAAALAQTEAALRAKLAHDNDADLHGRLGDVEESEGHALDAVKEYQTAAEMEPSEAHLFAWGAELLLHHAPEPAIEVFAKGHHMYPQSSRMLLGLGASKYAQRADEQAERFVLEACDLRPADPVPYLFLGRLQITEQVTSPAVVDRMKRFVVLHPENANAHYLSAMALLKQGDHPELLDTAESELKTAIQLDPHLGDAYLYLGIIYSERGDLGVATTAFQNAIANTPFPEEAHYRLAQVYRRAGETEKAKQEVVLFKQLSEQKDAQVDRERHEIPQFVYTLREPSQNQPPDSH